MLRWLEVQGDGLIPQLSMRGLKAQQAPKHGKHRAQQHRSTTESENCFRRTVNSLIACFQPSSASTSDEIPIHAGISTHRRRRPPCSVAAGRPTSCGPSRRDAGPRPRLRRRQKRAAGTCQRGGGRFNATEIAWTISSVVCTQPSVTLYVWPAASGATTRGPSPAPRRSGEPSFAGFGRCQSARSGGRQRLDQGAVIAFHLRPVN